MICCTSCMQEFNVGIRCQICQAKFWKSGYVRELEQRVDDLERLCVCYRTGKKPSDRLLDRMAKSKDIVRKDAAP